MLKDKIIDEIIRIEGGYVNDPSDSGGETRYGITKAVALENGYTGDMKSLPRELAVKIYEDKYWEPLHLTAIERMSPKIAEELADTGVNMGIKRAAKFMQRSLNVLNNKGKIYPDLTVDSQLGAKTLRALGDYLAYRGKEGEEVLYKMLNCLQGSFYVVLSERREKDERYIFGWFLNRVR
jgi:lysozyme family protein